MFEFILMAFVGFPVAMCLLAILVFVVFMILENKDRKRHDDDGK